MNLRPIALIPAALLCLLPLAASAQSLDWRTPAEISNYRTTPDYAETVAYLDRIAAANPAQVRIESFGKTGEGRDLKIVIASKDGVFDPAAIHAAGRAILLVQNSIHAGEMDGKDACLALLRDIAITKAQAALLDHVVFVFIPVYNLDGHERRSPYNRINQNGPELAGWRGNATNLNLNRDYMKADAPETRAFLKMFERWLPDFFVDNHVTDGMDYQYDVTFAIDAGPAVAPATAQWIRETVTPDLERQLDASGHLAFPSLVDLNDDTDPAQGLSFTEWPPRFSTGEMNLENRPGLIVELHMLKDYKTRVTGNYEILRALLEVMNRDAAKLIALNREADADAARLGAHPLGNDKFPLTIAWNGETTPVVFHGYQFTRSLSEISGAMGISYRHEPWNVTLTLSTGAKITASTTPPAAVDACDRRADRARRNPAPHHRTLHRQGRALPLQRHGVARPALRGPPPHLPRRRRRRAAGPLRRMHSHHRDPHLPRRFGCRPAQSAAFQGRCSLARTGRARLRPALGLLRFHLRATGVRRGLRA